MDERSSTLIVRSMAITLSILYLVIIISCIWKYVNTKDITNSTVEIALIVMIPAAITWFARKDESLALPKNIRGETLSTNSDKQSKIIRKRHYIWDSIGFALFILILTIITAWFENDWHNLLLFSNVSNSLNITLTLAIEFVISVVIFYIIGYLLNELAVRRYNRKIDELENDDE